MRRANLLGVRDPSWLTCEQRVLRRHSRVPNKERRRPRYVYSAPAGKGKAPAVAPSSSTGVVSLSFSWLSRVCRFGKCVFCMEVRVPCSAGIAPKFVEGY